MDHCFRFSNNQGAQYWALTGEILVNKTWELNLLMVWSLRNGTRLDIYIINIDMYGYSSICHSDVITEFQLSLFWVNSAFENSMRQSWTNTATCYKIYSLSLQAFYRCTPTFCAATFVVLCSLHFFQFGVSVVILMRIFGFMSMLHFTWWFASFSSCRHGLPNVHVIGIHTNDGSFPHIRCIFVRIYTPWVHYKLGIHHLNTLVFNLIRVLKPPRPSTMVLGGMFELSI